MGLRDLFRSQSTGRQTGYEALELPPKGVDTLIQAMDDYPREAIVARPNKSNGGIPAMHEVLESLYTTDTRSRRFSRQTTNVAAAHAFELRYAREHAGAQDRVLSMQYLAGSDDRDGMLEEQLTHNYPDSLFDRQSPIFLDVQAGQFVAGATLALRRYTLYPIKTVAIDDFGSDPTGSIIQQMVSHSSRVTSGADADVVVQIMFRPALRDWLQGVPNGQGVDPDPPAADSTVIEGTPSVSDLTWSLKQPTWEKYRNRYFPWKSDWIKHDPTKRDLAVAAMLNEQDGKAWHLCFRIFAVSDDPAVAIERASKTAGMFRNFYEYRGEQTFLAQPFSRTELPDQLTAGAQRVFEDGGIVKTQREVAGVVNIPKATDISTNKMRWTLSKPGDGAPVGTPRFDFEAMGLAADASREEKQAAMLNASAPGTPFMFGFDSKHGTEAGMFEEFTNAHIQVTGTTRMGKTTFGTNFASQVMSRGYGALIIALGKDDDDEKFIAEWPGDRPREDFVFIDTSDTFEKRARFNLLEIPEQLEPGTTEHRSYTESLADDFCASFAQAGGDSELYPLMRGITRTTVRGMARSGRTCTPIDLAAACSHADNMDLFAQWMSGERMHFIEDTAHRFAEKNDADLEPIARRMDELIHNGNVRDWLSAREPTVRIQDLVNDGKVAVLRIDPALGDTERAFSINPVVRRFAHAKKIAHKTKTNTDQFHFIWDEADKVITSHSNVASMLSEFAGYGARFCLLYQSPSYQLPDDLRNATEAQIDTTISFRTKGADAQFIQRVHSDNVDAGALRDLPRHSFYMNTDTKDNTSTGSFQADAFKPARDIREQVNGEKRMTDEEIQEMKRQSVEDNGDVVQTAEEVKAESVFYTDALEHDAQDDTRELVETLLAKASYDEMLHATRDEFLDALIDMGNEPDRFDTWVDASPVRDRFIRYLSDVDARAAESVSDASFASLLETTDDIEVRTHDETTQIRCQESAPNRFKGSGDHQTAGKWDHRKLLRQVYEPLTRLGLEVTIPEQTGGRDVDAVGRIRESLPERELVERGECAYREYANARADFFEDHPRLAALTDGDDVTIEAEKATAKKPGKTCRKLATEYAHGQKCLFVVPEDLAMRVYNALTDPPYVNWDDGNRARLYNLNTFTIDGETPLRPNTTEQTHWYLEHETGDLVLMDGDDGDSDELARITSRYAVEASLSAYPTHTGEVDPTTIGEHGDWRPIKAPFDPRAAFSSKHPADWPTEDDWEILPVGDDVKTLSPLVVEENANNADIPPREDTWDDLRLRNRND